ncbi:fluoride efflux transporter CrcB [Bacillus sp. FJAT-27251]|uniref:fluoride efflux transporter CrcB n=1 Tax=Bacillus sp. FJAT-27251 TaxID=1684142 RepID=UPI0006A7D73B|nr:fluoride efflux transporter CrcB [Bacillus sp. FJAT-27251]
MIWLVGLGGSLGAAVRYFLGVFVKKHYSRLGSFPLGTFIINMTGSYLLGMLLKFQMENSLPAWIWFFLGIGFCGAYTTMSTFGYEALELLKAKKWLMAAFYIVFTVVLGLLAAGLGLYL